LRPMAQLQAHAPDAAGAFGGEGQVLQFRRRQEVRGRDANC
jgi:hypothetical protein